MTRIHPLIAKTLLLAAAVMLPVQSMHGALPCWRTGGQDCDAQTIAVECECCPAEGHICDVHAAPSADAIQPDSGQQESCPPNCICRKAPPPLQMTAVERSEAASSPLAFLDCEVDDLSSMSAHRHQVIGGDDRVCSSARENCALLSRFTL